MLGKVGPNFLPAKKPTDIMANHHLLLKLLVPARCDGSHQHDQMDGGCAKDCELWPWKLANKIASGIAMLKQHLQESMPDIPTEVFPTVGTDMHSGEHVADPESWRRCPGCRGRQSKFDPRHNRVEGECKWPHVTAKSWSCPGCQKHRSFGDSMHTLDETCKHAVLSHRTGVPRSGRHPRAPAQPASKSETQDLQSQLADGRHLGEDDEQQFSEVPASQVPHEILRLAKLEGWTEACNGDPALVIPNCVEFIIPQDDIRSYGNCPLHESYIYRTTWAKYSNKWYLLELVHNWTDTADRADTLPGLADCSVTIFHQDLSTDMSPFVPIDSEQGHKFNPRTSAPKHRKTYHDASVGSEHASDWTRFNVSRSLRALSAGNIHVQRRELRKLHLRWWHAGKESMKRILSAAGLGKDVLEEVVRTVDTCRECRMWSRPAHETIPTLRMSTKFNEHVECDLIYYREFIIFHLICCCTRWHAAVHVNTRSEEELFSALHKCWITTHGPMQYLICDGELGIMGPTAQSRLKRLGIEPKIRAPGQHARFIERRGAILRQSLHCLESQLMREGISAEFDVLLAEAVFAGNALIHIGGVTPYQCVFGRSPAMLPPLPEETEGQDGPSAGSDRVRQHVRTAAIEAMVQATSLARTSRTLRAKSIAATETKYQAGDLVDYHRPSSAKDISGWHGPAEVIEAKPNEGMVIIRIHGQPKPCRLQDVRHTLYAHISFSYFVTFTTQEALQVLHSYLNAMPERHCVTLGFITGNDGRAHVTPESAKQPHVLQALDYLIEQIWNFEECHAARLGKGQNKLPKVGHATHSTLIYWNFRYPKDPSVFFSETPEVRLQEIVGSSLNDTVFIQLLHNSNNPAGLCDSLEAIDSTHEDPDVENPSLPDHHSDRLSTINEGSNESAHSQEEILFEAFCAQHFHEVTSDLKNDLKDLWFLYQDSANQQEVDQQEEFPLLYVEPEDPMFRPEFDMSDSAPRSNEEEPFVTEMYISQRMSTCFGDPLQLQYDEMFSIRIYNAVGKVEVVKRASDLLTKEELITHKNAVNQAILEELRIWDNYGCFKMVPRKGAENIIDSRFVAKWKVKDPNRPYESRIIRIRMALRGFKEWCADLLDSHAATANRISQRLLISEAAVQKTWSFLSLDINKAVLQGVTYKEMAAATGEKERVVHFTLPPGAAVFLRMSPGFESYNERFHVLKCVKPGTGCKDAPRAFSIKLASVTRDPKVGLKPLSGDPETEVKHVNGRLVLIICKHVDDLKIAGVESEVQNLILSLEKVFGKIDRNDGDFTCVGIHHSRKPDGSIELDQDEYISSMKPIIHADLTSRAPEELCSEPVMRLYWSLLGAVAYTLLTQHWIAVYVIALQRVTHKPQNQHVRKLNSLLKVLQKQKIKIVYPNMSCSRHIMTFSDASFCKETESKGYGMRGTVILRLGCNTNGVEECCHLLDATSQSLKLVTRSTFSSETLAAVGSVDQLIPIMIALDEIQKGPYSPHLLRQARECSDFLFDSTLSIDAMNLFHHMIDTSRKLPSEKSLFPHLWWLRDATRCAPKHLRWCDTRDMIADAMTKGSVLRNAILDVMRGFYRIHHETKEHSFTHPAA